jgi:hypothetical protein
LPQKTAHAIKTDQRWKQDVCLADDRMIRYTRIVPEMAPACGGMRWGRFFEATLFRFDQDMPALAAFENAMSEMV